MENGKLKFKKETVVELTNLKFIKGGIVQPKNTIDLTKTKTASTNECN